MPDEWIAVIGRIEPAGWKFNRATGKYEKKVAIYPGVNHDPCREVQEEASTLQPELHAEVPQGEARVPAARENPRPKATP